MLLEKSQSTQQLIIENFQMRAGKGDQDLLSCSQFMDPDHECFHHEK